MDQIIRRQSRRVMVGDVQIGGEAPIVVQSMTNTFTKDVKSTVEQILRLEEAGCEIIRVAVADSEDADAIKAIKKQIHIPMVADIHFDYRLALKAIENGIDKLRINPGNIGSEERLRTVVEKAKEYRAHLIELAADFSEDVMTCYLEGKEPTEAQLKKAIRTATLQIKLIPILCGTSFKNKGVQPMLDAVCDYLPSPLDRKDLKGVNPETNEEEARPADDNAPFAALAFKIQADPFIGKLTYIRVYSGSLQSGSYVFNPGKNTKERISRIVRMHSNNREEIKEIRAGDIAAVVGLKNTGTGWSMQALESGLP